jgi:ketosteroid isomerase-like protein
MMSPEVAIVVAWHDALNAGDVDRLVALSSEHVEVGGPRGFGQGAQLLRDWAGRAGIRLDVRRVFQGGDDVVVEEDARWRVAETGKMTGSQVVATVFRVRDVRVVRVARYSDLAPALEAAGLDESAEVPQA